MNIPIKPKEPNKSFEYECWSYHDANYEKNDLINKKYPFLYLSDVLDHLPENWENIIKYIKIDLNNFRTFSILVPMSLNSINEYEKELKQYQLDLQKYELEMAKYELHLAEEKLKNLEKFYAKT